jgi:hypothetical protein
VDSGACNARGGALYLSVTTATINSCELDSNRVKTTSTTEVSIFKIKI